jgi:hypothetical protein
MNKVFSNSRIILLVLVLSTFTGAEAWALGQLTFIAKTEDGRIKLSLMEEEGHFFGEIREGITVITPVEVTLESKMLKIGIGEQDFIIERWKLGKYISYGGVIQDNRGISAQAELNDLKLTISGTIEDERNNLIDFEVIANDQKGSLELHWGTKYLFLNKIADKKPGGCHGGLIKEDLAKLGGFWCSSSGSLEDAFFNDPDQILAWIVALFVK